MPVDTYAPVTVWVTFYDPVPIPSADVKKPAVFTPLDQSTHGYQIDASKSYNALLTAVRAQMMSPPIPQDKPDLPKDPRTAMWSFELSFSDPDGIAAEQMSYVIGEGVPIDVSFGYQEAPESEMVVLKGIIVSRQMHLGAMDGMSITVRAISTGVAQTKQMPRQSHQWKPGVLVQDIMLTIASDYGWDKGPERLIVQPGAALVKPVLYNTQNDVYQFIRTELVQSLGSPPATTGEPYQLYVDSDGAVHFHEPAWKGNVKQPSTSDMIMILARQPDGPVLDCRVESNLFKVMQMGLAEALESAWIKSGGVAGGAPTNVENRGETAPADSTGVVGSGVMPYIPVRAHNDDERAAKTRFFYEHLRRQCVNLTLRLRGRSDFKLFDPFLFTYPRADGTSHYISGTYTVFSVEHSVDEGGWVTEVNAYRLAFGEEDPAQKQAGAKLREVKARQDSNAAMMARLASDNAAASSRAQAAADAEALALEMQRRAYEVTMTPGYGGY